MKNLLRLLCILTAIFCIVFPFTYFHHLPDKKEIKLSHILVDTEEDALKAKDEIKKFTDFNGVAKKYSKDYNEERRADIGYFSKYNNFPKEFTKAAFDADKYTVVGPLETQRGWHLIMVFDVVWYSDRENFQERYFYPEIQS